MSLLPWQASQWQRLRGAIHQDRLPHALLLAGPRGLGVPEFAQHMAAVLLCQASSGDEPCGHCRSCVLFAAGNHPDLFMAVPEEGARQIKVDTIRELVDYIHLNPVRSYGCRNT